MTRQSILLSALGFVLVLTLWWLFFMSPQRAQIATIVADTEAVEQEAVNLQTRISRLELVRTKAAEIESAIATLEGVVPSTSSMPSALQQIQAAADDAGLVVPQLASSRPSPIDGAPGLHVINLNISALGSYFQVVDFLRRLEDPTITIRGIDINTVSIAGGEGYPELTVVISANMYAVLDTATAVEPAPPAPAEEPSEES